MGVLGLAAHTHRYLPKDSPGYFTRLCLVQNVSAITGACLMIKKDLYESVRGLDEKNLAIAFNDVDFCLRLREKGLLNIYTPYCELYHYESKSRGTEDTPEKKTRFLKEVDYMCKRHSKMLNKGDPYYNPNLTTDFENFDFDKNRIIKSIVKSISI
jgi:GT2 family glycosyltransferase